MSAPPPLLDGRLRCTCVALILVGAVGCAQFLSYQLIYGVFGGISGILSIVAGSMPLCCMKDATRAPILRASLGTTVACLSCDGTAVAWQIFLLVGVNEASDELGGWTGFLNAWVGVALGISLVSLATHAAATRVLCTALASGGAASADAEAARPPRMRTMRQLEMARSSQRR